MPRPISTRRRDRWLDGRIDALQLLGLRRSTLDELDWHAHSLFLGGRPADAARLYDLMANLAPLDVRPWRGRGACRATLGLDAEAEADFDRALAIDPADPFALAGRAEVCLRSGRSAEALVDAEAALRACDRDRRAAADLAPRARRLRDLAAIGDGRPIAD